MSARRLLAPVTVLAVLVGLAAVAVPIVGSATGRWRLLPILSGSMAPQIPTGALALGTPEPTSAVRPGQVIVFRIPIGDHHVTAHRVVRVIRPGSHPVVVTKGDANSRPDPWQARLAGTNVWRIRASAPFIGYAAVYVGRARLLVLALVALLPIGVCLRLLWRRPRRDREAVVTSRAARSA
jgi:signal peptidase I